MTDSKALTSRLARLFAPILQRLPPQTLPASPLQRSPAGHLLDSANARSGLDPHQARELRLAARAYLSVVR